MSNKGRLPAASLAGVVVTALVVIAITYAQALRSGSDMSWAVIGLPTILMIAPGAVIGPLVRLVYDQAESLKAANTFITDAKIFLPVHLQIQDVLKHASHHRLLMRLVHLSASKFCAIPSISPSEFYSLLVEALDGCSEWDGVHQGDLAKLKCCADEADETTAQARLYFAALGKRAESQRLRARRIVIVSEQELPLLQDAALMRAIWETTGKSVTSYFVSAVSLRAQLRPVGTLDDAALHDRQIFLQYDRAEHVVRFGGDERMAAIRAIFALLDDSLKSRVAHGFMPYHFTTLTEAYVQQLERQRPTGAAPQLS